MRKNPYIWRTAGFFGVEAVLYGLILTAGGDTLRYSEFSAIVLCFIYGAIHFKTAERWIQLGLLCTVGADFFLVACVPQQQLWGMVFFLGAQTCYAICLWQRRGNKTLLWARLGLIAVAELVTVLVLRKKTDPLALISLAYYAMLIMNIITAFTQWDISKRLPLALVLFLFCDTVVGLQVAAGGYLPIPEGSPLHRILFSGFNLAWFFYLPSQVLLALCATKKRKL